MTSMIRLTPHAQAPGAAGRAVQGVERALLVAARRALAPHRERVVADDGGAGGLDGRGVSAEAADDHGGEGAGAAGQVDARGEARAAAVVGDVHGDAGAGDRAGDAGRLAGLLLRIPEMASTRVLPSGGGSVISLRSRFETCQRTAETFDAVPVKT